MTEAQHPTADELRDTLRDDLATQLHRLQDDLNTIKETMSKGAKAEANSVIADLEDFARKNPGAVVGGAVGLGVVLGLLLRRR
jgi:ElaB/YqjD/DUF883 family membrane-anchored ribosome-binding protein